MKVKYSLFEMSKLKGNLVGKAHEIPCRPYTVGKLLCISLLKLGMEVLSKVF
jgi:hypothetical protein